MDRVISLKYSYRGSVGRISVSSIAGFADVCGLLKKALKVKNVDSVFYVDEEGDKIKLTTDLEWREAVQMTAKTNFVAPIQLLIEGEPESQTIENSSFDQKLQFTQHLANNVVPQFFGIQPNADSLSTSTLTADAPQQIFSSFGQLLNSVPKEQLGQIIGGLMTNPMVNQLMSQLLVSIAAMSPQLMASQAPRSPAPAPKKDEPTNFTLHDAVCDSCSNRIVGVRYKCSVCADFDLCETCEKKDSIGHNEQHPFIKIKRNIPKPDAQGIWDSKFVCDITFPNDEITLPVGTKFTKTWRLENCGTAKWPIGTKLISVGGQPISANPEMIVPSIDPKQYADISLECETPKQPGRYVCFWRLAAPNNQQFGVKIWVTLIVENSAAEEQKKAEEARQAVLKKEQENLQAEILKRLEAERQEKARLEAEKFAQQRLEKERQEKERLEKERAEREANRQRIEVERQQIVAARLAREKEEAEKMKQEKIRREQERQESEKLEKERLALEKERVEKDRLLKEKERLERETIERELQRVEKLEKERLEKERVEKERLEKERLEKERLEKEEAERKKKEQEKLGLSTSSSNTKFAEGLRSLGDMGFDNKEKNIQLMIKHNGDIMAVVQDLLNM